MQSCSEGGPVSWPQRTVRLAYSIDSQPTEHSTFTQALQGWPVGREQDLGLIFMGSSHQGDLLMCKSALIPLFQAHHQLPVHCRTLLMWLLPIFSVTSLPTCQTPPGTALLLSVYSGALPYPRMPFPSARSCSLHRLSGLV